MSLFPEPSTTDKVASVDHLRADARAKIEAAAKMNDVRIAEHWRQELDRLTRIRAATINNSQGAFL
jgi:hypothetical protein